MIKFLLLTLFVSLSFSNFLQLNCYTKLATNAKQVYQVLQMSMNDQKIDALTGLVSQLRMTIESCLGQNAQSTFQHELPDNCVTDLNKAAKIGLRMQNQKDNQLLFAKDLLVLQRLYQNKVRKQCPFLTDVSYQDAAKCMEDSYRFSLIVQKLGDDLKKQDKTAVLSDIDSIVSKLPNVLQTCGHPQWANQVRNLLPLNCVHAVQDLLMELSIFEHNYTHMQWLVKNYKNLWAYFSIVRINCPIFY